MECKNRHITRHIVLIVLSVVWMTGCGGDGGGSGSDSGGDSTPQLTVTSVQLGTPISSGDGSGSVNGPLFSGNLGEIIINIDPDNPSGYMSVWMQANVPEPEISHYDWEIVGWQNQEPYGDISYYDEVIDIDPAQGGYKVRSFGNKVRYNSTSNFLISSNHNELIKVTAWTVDGYFTTAYFNLSLVPDPLDGWWSFSTSGQGRYVIGLIGDSYTHYRDRYSKRLKESLTGEFGNLGAGYIGFSYQSGGEWSNNGSIDESELDYTIDQAEWAPTYCNGYGPDACHISSEGDTSRVTVHVLRSVDEMKLLYATEPSPKRFQYRIAGGSWQVVPIDGAEELGVETVNVQNLEAPYNIEIQALDAGVTLIGAEAVQFGDGVVVHKLAATGAQAASFARNPIAQASLQELNLDMAIIMFGTNEQAGNISPLSFKGSVQNIVDSLKSRNPAVDLVFMLPCYTKYEFEVPTDYSLQDYGQVLRELTFENNGYFVDFTEVFGPASELQNLIDSGLMSSDRVHPTTGDSSSGGAFIADTVLHSVLSVP